jgi:predicted AAA+ superfamily ATPase
MTMFLKYPFLAHHWWSALERLVTTLDAPGPVPAAALRFAYADLAGSLAAARQPDVATAIAAGLVDLGAPFQVDGSGSPASGALRLLELDLATLAGLATRDLGAGARAAGLATAPALLDLAPASDDEARRSVLARLAGALARGAGGEARDVYLDVLRTRGSGPAALNQALRFTGGRLTAVAAPQGSSLADLVGLDDQLTRLIANTQALLERRPSHNTLLYGPRGSGKSTAVRGLLERFAGDGLRLVELPVEELGELATLLDDLRHRPQAFVLFVDDLGFEDGDAGYRPLKTLLEGGLSGRPANVALYATSNRRHLVNERFADRPDPLDDDVHRWDTHHEKLALADRFGLTLTFPDAGQRRYLELIRALAARRELVVDDLDEHAIRFAEWGNGYSGRTARQFIDTLMQTLR